MTIHAKLIDFHKRFNGAKKSGVNPHFRSQYMTLDDLVLAVTPVLNELDLFAYHFVDGGDLVTVVADAEGDKIESRIPMTLNGNPQAAGSMVTYYKRYNLGMLLNVVTDTDDDGNAAAAATPKMATKKTIAALYDFAQDNDERVAFLDKRAESLTEEQAQSIIERWKA